MTVSYIHTHRQMIKSSFDIQTSRTRLTLSNFLIIDPTEVPLGRSHYGPPRERIRKFKYGKLEAISVPHTASK